MTTIAIVDDARFMRSLIRGSLEPLGYEIVGEGENGLEAIELCKRCSPDVLTLDIVMPELDGIQALEVIRRVSPSTRVVVVTAVDQREYTDRAITLGIADFIVKPFEESRVISAVDRALSRSWPPPA